jgi:hypothetical protein
MVAVAALCGIAIAGVDARQPTRLALLALIGLGSGVAYWGGRAAASSIPSTEGPKWPGIATRALAIINRSRLASCAFDTGVLVAFFSPLVLDHR